MTEKRHCIILRTVKYGDSQLIVDMLTPDAGRVSAVWRMPRGAKGRGGRNAFQPLSVCDVIVERTRSSRLPLIKEVHIASPYATICTDPVKISVAFFIAEFLSQVSRAEQADAKMYDFIENTLLWYDLTDAGTANFHIMFLVRVSRFLGFYPNMESYSRGCVFDMRAAEFCSYVPPHKDFLSAAEAERLGMLMRMTPANMHYFRFSRDERNRIVETMLRFYALHVPGFKEMKSWEVLRSIFR